MPHIDDDLAYDNVKINPAHGRGHSTKGLRSHIISVLRWHKVNVLVFSFTTIALLTKSILFIGLINNDNATSYSSFKAFRSFSSPPPLVVYVSLIVIVLSFAFLFQGRTRFWFLIIFNSLFSLLLVGDLMYYRGFCSFVSPYLLSETTNLDNLSSSVVSMLRPVDLLFFSDLLVLVGSGLTLKKFHFKAKRNVYSLVILLALSVSYVYYQHVQLDLKGKGEDMLFRVSWSPNQTMSNLSPLGYHAFDIYNYYENKQTEKLSSKENQEIKNWFAQKQENLPTNQYSGLFKGQNLIIIQVESLENFVINQKVNDQEITPNLNKLLANSFYFSKPMEVNAGTQFQYEPLSG